MNLNVEIKISEEVNRTLNVMRALRGMTKKAIITEALEHYAACMGGLTTNARRETIDRAEPGRAEGEAADPQGSPSPAARHLSQ